MSLANILLGLINEPKSGYDIKQMFEEVLHYIWNADLAQIYPTLKKMEANGLATSEIVDSNKGPAKKLYTRTKKGTLELRQWLLQGPQVNTERLHYLAQVFFLSEVSAPQRIRFFETLEQYLQQQLDELIAVDQHWASEDPSYPDDLPDKEQAMQFTLRLGLVKIKASIGWCQSCLSTLHQQQESRP